MKNQIKKFLAPLAVLLIVSILLPSCVVVDPRETRPSVPEYSSSEPVETEEPKISKFTGLELIDSLFETYSLFEFDDETLITAAIKAYVEATGDKYAEYYTEKESEALRDDNIGKTVGIGVSVLKNADTDCIEIITVSADSPAEEAGLMAGDLITEIKKDGQYVKVADIGYSVALELLRGEEGTTAEFKLVRGDADPTEYQIVRRTVISASVMSHVSAADPTVGIVRIVEFDLIAPAQFETAMNELIENGCTKFVYDVRNNPGGDLKSVKAILSNFLSNGDTFIRVKNNRGDEASEAIGAANYTDDYVGCSIRSENIGRYRDYPCVILTNGSTASAAELFTGTMRDYEIPLATVGEKTYGKGTMQSIYDLSAYGYKGMLKLTTRYYCPPITDSYNGIGLYPTDEVVIAEEYKGLNISRIPEDKDNQLAAALDILLGEESD